MSAQGKNQALAQGAFFAAGMAAAGLLAILVPPLFFPAVLFIPLPLVVLVRCYDLKTGLFAVVIFCALLFLFAGFNPAGIILVLQTVPLGLLLGLLLKNHVSPGVSIALGALTLTAFAMLGLAVSFWATGNNPLAAGEEMEQVMERAADWYTRLGLTEELPRSEVEQIIAQTAKFVSQLFPAHLVTLCILSALFTYLLARKALQKIACPLPPLPPFVRWQFPWQTSWGLIAGLVLTLGGDALHILPAAVLGKNILYVSVFLYLIAGLAVAGFYLTKWKVPGLLKFFLLFFAFFYLPLAAAVIALLGVMDSFLNLRRSMEGKK
ncbi:MAG: YybS family protein [Armatimonadetes bacterium]|nr:YybS family protein [Armatimonadota bacterium]